MGTPSFATMIFNTLIDCKEFEVVALFTQPDKKGNKNRITKPHIKEFYEKNSLSMPIYQMDKLNKSSDVELIKSLKPDFIIVAAFGQILQKEILDIATCINLHASILPLYRGSSPIQYSILNGDKYSGITAMLMEEGLDCGDILAIKFVDIKDSTNEELFNSLSIASASLIIDVIKNFTNILPIKQKHALSNYAPKIKKEDGMVKFLNATTIDRKYRAYLGWPSIYLDNGLKLTNIRLEEKVSKNQQGEILSIKKDYIIIGCLVGSITISSVQIPTKKETTATTYVTTKQLKVGDIFS
jgi:methionyl-tRNA formyltransferase